jgi:hypothetical protein
MIPARRATAREGRVPDRRASLVLRHRNLRNKNAAPDAFRGRLGE